MDCYIFLQLTGGFLLWIGRSTIIHHSGWVVGDSSYSGKLGHGSLLSWQQKIPQWSNFPSDQHSFIEDFIWDFPLPRLNKWILGWLILSTARELYRRNGDGSNSTRDTYSSPSFHPPYKRSFREKHEFHETSLALPRWDGTILEEKHTHKPGWWYTYPLKMVDLSILC